jgi:microcystin-dependent protein
MATVLTGCGGRGVSGLPGLGPAAVAKAPAAGALRLVPDVPDPIPASVLAEPIVGEARRYAGTTAPNGWLFARGQTLEIALYPHLFSVLGTIAGGDGKKTFLLPAPRFPLIVATAGTFLTSPAMLASSARHLNAAASVIPGARPAPARVKQERPGIEAARLLAENAIAAGPARSSPLSYDMSARIANATANAREAAMAWLTAANRSLVSQTTATVVAGGLSPGDAVARMAGALSTAESSALLDVNDKYIAIFRDRPSEALHENPQLEAARFLMSVAYTADQIDALELRER